MKYEGHSCLWHYLLVPFAKSGLSFDAVKIIGIIPAIITAVIILKKAPFNMITKVLLIFSSPFIYIMPAIVRPYTLLPILIILLCMTYKDRREKSVLYGTILFFISNVHITLIGFTGILTIFFFIEDLILNIKKSNTKEIKKMLIGTFISVIGIIFVAFQAIRGSINSTVGLPAEFNINIIMANLANCWNEVLKIIFGIEQSINRIVITIAIISLLIIQGIFSPKHSIILTVSVLWFAFVHAVVFNIMLNQRAAILLMFIVFYAWCYRFDMKNKKNSSITKTIVFLLSVICVISLPKTIGSIKNEIHKPYVDSKQIVQSIETNIEEGSIILANCNEGATSIIAYLNNEKYKFYNLYYNEFFTFITWKKNENNYRNLNKLKESETCQKYILVEEFSTEYDYLPEG